MYYLNSEHIGCSADSFAVYCTLLLLFPIGLSPFHTKNNNYKDNYKEIVLKIILNIKE